MNEIKILILDIEGGYKVYSDGRVFSTKRNKFLSTWFTTDGYLRTKVNNKSITIHRLLAQCFIPNPLNLETVNHINKIKTDNRLENLEWMSRVDNVKHGLQRTYKFISPSGEICTFTGLNDFCKEHGLQQSLMSKVISGERDHHREWRKV